MKSKLIMSVLVLLSLTFSFALSPAFGALTGSTSAAKPEEIFDIDKNAPGTKVLMTITLYYESIDSIEDPDKPGCNALCENEYGDEGQEAQLAACLEACLNCFEGENSNMHYFIRAEIGNDNLTTLANKAKSAADVDLNKSDSFYPFAGVAENTCVKEYNTQQSIIEEFMMSTIIPELFYGEDITMDDIKIKSVEKIINDDNDLFADCCVDNNDEVIHFLVMDVVIGVQ